MTAMGDFAKIIRWTAPGLVAWVPVLFVVLPSTAFLGTNMLDAGISLAVLPASAPMGMLIYQVYFYQYARPPRLLRFVHDDVAARLGANLSRKAGIQKAYEVGDVPFIVPFVPLVMWKREYHAIRWLTKCRVTVRWPARCDSPERSAGGAREPDNKWSQSGEGAPVTWRCPCGKSKRGHFHRWGTGTAKQIVSEYYRQRERNWQAVDQLLLELERRNGSDKPVIQEHKRLADIYHTLGACRLALFVGAALSIPCGIYSIMNASVGPGWSVALHMVTAGSIVLGTAFLSVVLHRNREHSLDRRIALLDAVLAHR